MKNKDQLLLEQAYQKIYENESLLVPRRSKEEREKNYKIATLKRIQEYIKNGSKGDLDLSSTPITSLPNVLKVGGTLNFFNTLITSLPEGLEVGEDLYLASTPITSLPKGLKVGGHLSLHDTRIASLPEGLRVGGNLYLQDTLVNLLPNDLEVGGCIFIHKTPLSKKYSKKQIKKMYPGIRGHIF